MKTLYIPWLGACPKCDNETHKVETEKGCGFGLYEGDKTLARNAETSVVSKSKTALIRSGMRSGRKHYEQ